MDCSNCGHEYADHVIDGGRCLTVGCRCQVYKEPFAHCSRKESVMRWILAAILGGLIMGSEAYAADPPKTTICTGDGCLVGTLVPSPIAGYQRFMVGDVKKGVVKDGWYFPANGEEFGTPIQYASGTSGACTCVNCPGGGNCTAGQCGQAGCQSVSGCSSCSASSSSCGSSGGRRQGFFRRLFHRRGGGSCGCG